MKTRRYIYTLLAMLLACTTASGEETPEQTDKVIKGFSGGMMIHSGYQFGGDNPYGYIPKGGTFGLGGVARVHLSKHFRSGFEGYFSTMGLKKGVESGSHNKVFWTGALADFYWNFGKFYPYAGATVGGGMETSCYIFEGDKHDWIPEGHLVYHKQGFFALDHGGGAVAGAGFQRYALTQTPAAGFLNHADFE